MKPILNSTSFQAGKGSEAAHWTFINEWQIEPQADDRTPMNGSVPGGGGSEASRRSFARQTHQLMFKKWSKGRHD